MPLLDENAPHLTYQSYMEAFKNDFKVSPNNKDVQPF
jgi:hypothetical protein